MNQRLLKLVLVCSFAGLAACNKGGGSDNKQVAQVPAAPQGTTYAQINGQANNQIYCTLNAGTIVCYSNNNFGQACNTSATPYAYTDVATMCRQLSVIQSQYGYGINSTCNVTDALNAVYAQYACATVIGQPTLTPAPTTQIDPNIGNQNQNNDPNLKTVQCDFEAYRISQGKWLRREARTPKLTTTISFDGRFAQVFDLKRRFLGFDIGDFGRTKLMYTPGAGKFNSDTLTISNVGFNETMRLNQSGFAGQTVRLDVFSDDETLKMSISCAGKSQFKKGSVSKAFSKYVCKGTSSMHHSSLERIEFSAPLDETLANSEIGLGENLTAVVTGDVRSENNARITITAMGIGLLNYDNKISLVSSVLLKTTSKLSATDGTTTLELTCGPQ